MSGLQRLSVAIIARDEERYIGGCIDSVAGLADEVVVLVDQRSSDRTSAICHERGARVLIEPWRGFPAQRNRALDVCQSTWVLFLDADERVTPELREEIATLLNTDQVNRDTATPFVTPLLPHPLTTHVGYWIPRYNVFFGRRLRGGGWYPDRQLRLLRVGHARYDEDRKVHEVASLDGPTGMLSGHILHHNIDRLDEFWRKQTLFARIEAETLYAEERRVRLRNFVGAPLREFQRRFLQLGGWRDGALGLFLCGSLAWFELVAFLRLWGLWKASSDKASKTDDRSRN